MAPRHQLLLKIEYAAFVGNARPGFCGRTRILVQLNKGIRCKTGTRRADPSCCKHGADFLSAKAGHWGNLRRREAAWTISSERVSQKTYKLCV